MAETVSMERTKWWEGLEAVVLSFIGGMLDVYCLDNFNIYATMHTGNTIRLALNIADGNYSVIPEPLMIMIAFAIAIYVANVYESRRGKESLKGMLLIKAVLLIAAIFIPVDDNPMQFSFYDLLSAFVFGFIGAFIIHSFVKFNSNAYSATMMTANINRLMTTVFKRFSTKDKKHNYTILLYVLIILAFMLGVGFCHLYMKNAVSITGWNNHFSRNIVLLIPAVLMLVLVLSLHRKES